MYLKNVHINTEPISLGQGQVGPGRSFAHAYDRINLWSLKCATKDKCKKNIQILQLLNSDNYYDLKMAPGSRTKPVITPFLLT